MNAVTRSNNGLSGNLFLDSLPTSLLEIILPKLDFVSAPTNAPIASEGSPISYATFPTTCVISRVARMRDGTDVEIAIVGREGFYGTELALGTKVSVNEAMVQIPDGFARLESDVFTELLGAHEILRDRALRFVQATIDTVGQLSACNRLHSIHNRCARWLLMAHDRVPGDSIRLTHEFLATMLGVRRPGVSLAAAALESVGLIAYHRGVIIIRDRAGLEAAACECYDVISKTIPRLLGYDIRKSELLAAVS